MQFNFSINQYDRDGNCFDTCILGHFNATLILRFENLAELRLLIEKMQAAVKEIEESYPNA